MSRRAYFAQYTSPNIIIVPTVSFSPPRAEETLTAAAANISFINDRSTAGISRTKSVNYNNLKEIGVEPNIDGSIWSAGASDNSKCLMFKQQGSDTMECPSLSNNASQGIKELSSSLYKSRNNLVDLTGFNILKRDGINSTKNKNDLNIKDTTKRTETEGSRPTKRDGDKKASKSNEYKTHVSGERSINNTQSNEPTQSTTDMKDTMKKYFRHLWKRNIEKKLVKTKEQSKAEKPEKDPKRNRPKENTKELTLPSQSKVKLKKDTSDKSLENKTRDSRKQTDLKRKVKPECDRRSKSETKSSISANKTRSLISPSLNQEISSDDIKRHKDSVQRHNDTKNKSEKNAEQNSIKLNKTATESKIIARKKHIEKPEVNSERKKASNTKDLTNTVLNNNNFVLNNNTNEKQDLRPKQSLKRPRSSFKSEQDNNNVKTTLTKYKPPVKKSKPKKCKRIKLVINIECPSSGESDGSENVTEYSQPSPQDLTFLDDFDVDEIVDSLNLCRDTVECNKITSPIIKDTKPNNIVSTTQVAKKKIINDFNIKMKTDTKDEEVIIIHSDSENESESVKGFDATRNDCVKTIEICSNKPNISSMTNNIILKESNKCNNKISQQLSKSDKCIKESDIKGSKPKVCYKTDNKIFTKSNQSNEVKIPLQNNNEKCPERNESVNHITGNKATIVSEKISQFSKNISPKTTFNRDTQNTLVKNDNESLIKHDEAIKLIKLCSPIKKDEIELSLENMFNEGEPNFKINIDRDPSNVLNTYIKTKPQTSLLQSDDIIEKSLKTMFNSTDNEEIQICVKPSDPDENFVEKEIRRSQNLEDNVVESLAMQNDIYQCAETKIGSAPVNVINKEQTLKTTFSSNEDKDDIKNIVKLVIDKYLVKEENSKSKVTEPHEMHTDVNQNVRPKIYSAPVNENNKNINKVDTLQESADNNFPLNNIDKDYLNVKEETDNAAENSVDINIKMSTDTKINNTLLQRSNNEEENDNTNILNDSFKQSTTICDDISKQAINALKTNLADPQPRATVSTENNINTSNIKTGDIKLKIEDPNSLILSGANSDQIDISKDKMKKTLPNFKEKLEAQVTPKTGSDRKFIAINRVNYSRYKNEGFNKMYTNFNTDLGQVKSVVTANNNTKQNYVFKQDASLVGNSHSNMEDYEEERMTSKQFMENLETRMSEHLHTNFKLSSIIHNGYFSVIYKCKDEEDIPYAVKVLKHQDVRKGRVIGRMLMKVQNYTSIENSSVLFMIKEFGVGDNWCFLTEYYPRNLEQALLEKRRAFHINVVQKLSSQLIAAVAMLTNNNIIHTDIKPQHVLLNATNSKLKLCGFDRFIYRDKAAFLPNTGTANYRAPEIILGYTADCRIDVWATALVMFEMATSIKLFTGLYNNEILYKQMRELGSFDSDMISASKFRFRYFSGTSFIKRIERKKSFLIHAMHRNKNLEREIYMAYRINWQRRRTEWQVTEDLDKIERFHSLLKQMLVLDPRYRLPIQFIGASEFFHDLN